ncbi:MAG: DNA polymerase III subunit gamma/tau [Pseudomonadota bacterium]
MADKPATPYIVLARRYRPHVLDDLIGQEGTTRTLRQAIAQDRLAHAYLFCGVRGVGKTSLARILARAVNCESGPTATPCMTCDQCQALDKSRHMDVIECDAASRTGIDDVREIIEAAHYAPVMGRKKIYIIDEVHMMSTKAFNALLKTLEEPPPHVIFILATTEMRRLPLTIVSRCQRYHLRPVGQETLGKHLMTIAEKEHITLGQETAFLLARVAGGSIRDGLSLLDQAIALACAKAKDTGTITPEDVMGMIGSQSNRHTADLITAVMKGDQQTVSQSLRTLHDAGADPKIVLEDALALIHASMHARIDPKTTAADIDPALWDYAQKLALEISVPELARTWQTLMKGVEEMTIAPRSDAALDMIMIRATYMSHLPTPEQAVKALAGDTSDRTASDPVRDEPADSQTTTAEHPPSSSPLQTNNEIENNPVSSESGEDVYTENVKSLLDMFPQAKVTTTKL